MDENGNDGGRTAMERLCRELMENVNSYSWCREHIPSVIEDIGDWEMWDYGKAIAAVRSDIERRIAEADLSDDKARDRALVDWRERIAELDALCRVLNAESADEAVAVARTMAEEHYELKELREAGRIMPEGVSWPRYSDGEPVRMGDPFGAWDGQASEVRSVTLYAPGPDAAWAINAGSCRNFVGGSDEAHRMHGLRLKRPAPKAVGADGVEVKVGETVWLAPEWRKMANTAADDRCSLYGIDALDALTVESIMRMGLVDTAAVLVEGFAWCPASWLTHERPDTRSLVIDGMDEETVERIDRLVKDGSWLDD